MSDDLRERLTAFMADQYDPATNPSVVTKPPRDGLLLGDDPVTGATRWLELVALATSMVVCGGTGAGKSNFLRVLIWGLLKLRLLLGHGFAIVDPHGSLAKWTLKLIASQAPELAPHVFYSDLRQEHRVLSSNHLPRGAKHPHFAAACFAEAIVKGHGAQSTAEKPLITRVLQNVIQALIECGLSLADAHYFLERGPRERAVARNLLSRMPEGSPAKSFLVDLYSKPASTADAYAMGPMNRLDPLVRPTAFRRMLGSPVASVDVLEAMDTGAIHIVDGAREGSGVTVDGQHMWLAATVQEYRRVFEERVPDRSRPFTLVMDEFGDYVPADFARVLTGARKFGLRAVFAFQTLAQLVSKDQDRTLLETVLAIPSKVVFGGLPFGDCKILAEEMFLGAIDPEKVKHWVETVTWDPVPTKVTLRSQSSSESSSESESSGTSDAGTSSSTSGFSSQYGYTESEQEAWTTFFNKRVQKGTPVYRSIEEQAFEYAKRLRLAPVGQGVLARTGRLPLDFKARFMPDLEFTEEDIKPFLNEMYDKPVYLKPDELDRLIDEHERKLLAAARDDEDDPVY